MAALRDNVYGVTEVYGIHLAGGRVVFPGLCNSFQLERRGGIIRRLLFLWSLLGPTAGLIFVGTLAVALGLAIKAAQDAEFDRMAFIVDFGDVRPLNKRSGQPLIEIDEVFGNQYLKKDAPVQTEQRASVDDIIDAAPMGGVADFTAPVDLTPEIRAEYTPEARAAGLEGRIQLAIVIDPDGNVKYVKPVGRKLGLGLEDAAISAFKRKKYQPSKNREGQPVQVKMYVAAVFKLS